MAVGSSFRSGLAGLLLATACTVSTEPRGTDVLIFVDFSGSISDASKASFEQDIQTAIIPTLGAGDRILVAPIHDRTLTDFRTLVDTSFPAEPEFNGWSDNALNHQRKADQINAQVEEIKKGVGEQVSKIFETGFASKRTDIFSSLILAQKVFHNRQTRKVLILMSDMIVDYPPYQFDKIAWDPGTQDEMLSDLDEKGLIPDLSGVCVYVSGATAATAEQAARIGRFWQAYFERSGADMNSSRYAHVLLHWPPSESCHLGGAQTQR